MALPIQRFTTPCPRTAAVSTPDEIEAAERDIWPPDIHFEIDDVQKYFLDSCLKGYESVFVLAEQMLGPLVEFLCQV